MNINCHRKHAEVATTITDKITGDIEETTIDNKLNAIDDEDEERFVWFWIPYIPAFTALAEGLVWVFEHWPVT